MCVCVRARGFRYTIIHASYLSAMMRDGICRHVKVYVRSGTDGRIQGKIANCVKLLRNFRGKYQCKSATPDDRLYSKTKRFSANGSGLLNSFSRHSSGFD